MEVLTQNNDFVMFLFSRVLQMAEKILFQKQIKRDFLPCQNKQIWQSQEAEGEELRSGAWTAVFQFWPCCVLGGLEQVIYCPDLKLLKI